MSEKSYIVGISIATLFCWFVLALTIIATNPTKADQMTFFSFYLSLFFSLVGTFTSLNFYIRIKINKDKKIYQVAGTSLRQSILLAMSAIGLLFLQSARILNWWDGTLLVSAILLLELFFRAK